ncbi:MAG TPA: sugar transferase [Gemmatimonadaceae bacterium]|nr:sugar transferase [Gemmatimonadaceae bacterium]
MTAPSQLPTKRQKSKHHDRGVNLRASQVGLSVVRGIITPFTSHATIPPLEHNGTAMLNVRAHAIRATGRLMALVTLDIFASQTLRVVARALHQVPPAARVAAERLDLLVGVRGLGGLQIAAALVLGLFLAGAYGAGDRRRSVKSILVGCSVATLLQLWSGLWINPGLAALQIVFGAALLGAAVLSGRLVIDAVVGKLVPAPLPSTMLVGTADDCRYASDSPDEAIIDGFSVAGTIHIDELPEISVEGIRRQLVSSGADTLLLCGQLNDDTFATVVRAAMMAECRVLATARRLGLPGIEPKVIWRGGRPLIEMRTVSLRWQQLLLKRVLDVALASVLLVLFSPILLLIGAAIALTSRAPAVYGQRRPGHYGRTFRCLKFRTMHVDAEARLRADPELHAEFVANGFKLPEGKDPRITPLGRVLRRTSLDELPQLWNVLRGDMSIVGPRPILTDEIAHYEDDCHLLLLLKPGITGLWQVSGRSSVGYRERIGLQLQYVERWSLVRDLKILLRTVPAVLAQQGAH